MSQSKAQLVNDVKPSLAIGYGAGNSAVTVDSGVQLQLSSVEHGQIKISGDRGNHSSESYESRILFSIDGDIEYSAIRLGNYGQAWFANDVNNDNALIFSAHADSTYGGIVFETGPAGSSGTRWYEDAVRERVRITNSGLDILGGIHGTGATQQRYRVTLSSTMGLNTGDDNNAAQRTAGLNVGGTAYLKVPIGTTAQRPAVATAGMVRFNSTTSKLEQHNGTAWIPVSTPPVVDSLTYPGSQTAADPAGGETITLTGSNFGSIPIIKLIAPNGTEYDALSESFVSSTSVTFVTPNVSGTGDGDYDVRVENPDGGVALKTDFITIDGPVTFSSHAAGATIASVEEGASISVTIVASEPDSGTITYSVSAGALPSGVTLNTSTGVISGTAPTTGSDTNYNFTIQAVDPENQSATRSFIINVTVPLTMTGGTHFGG